MITTNKSEKSITRERVAKGYKQGIIQLKSPYEVTESCGGIVAQIGDYWFYFGGLTADEYDSVDEYKKDIPEDTIIDEIYETLDGCIYDLNIYEYNYYNTALCA